MSLLPLLLAALSGWTPVEVPVAHPVAPDTAQVVEAQPPAEEILLELRIGRLVERLVPALARGEEVLLPASTLLAMSEVDVVRADSAQLAARLQPGNRSLLLEAGGRQAELDGQAVEVGPGEVMASGPDLMVSTRLLEALLDVRFEVDMAELVATVVDPAPLPIGRRVDREQRWGIQGPGGAGRPPAELTLAPSPHRIGGFVAEWSLAADPSSAAESASGSLAAAAQLLGGEFRASGRSRGPMAGGAMDASASWRHVRPHGRVLRQLHLGDVMGAGPRPGSIRGIHLGNAPFVRDPLVGMERISGQLGPGWDVELRRHGQTVDLARVDERGAWALDIPLQYGNNAVEVVAWGPHGEVVTTEHLMVMQQERLPAGALEWGLSAGACTSSRCSGAGVADLRWGASRRWTLRAGAEGFVRDTLPDAVLPSVEVAGALHPRVQLHLAAVHDGFLRATTILTPRAGMRLRVAGTAFDTGVEHPVLHDRRRETTLEGDLRWQLRPSSDRFSLRASGVRETRSDLLRTRWEALAGLRVAGIRTEAGVRETGRVRFPGDAGALGDPSGSLELVTMARGRLGWIPTPGSRSAWGSAEVRLRPDPGTRGGRLNLTYPLGRDHQLQVAADQAPGGRPRLTLSLQSDWSTFRSVAQQFSGSSGSSQQVWAQGTARWNEATGGLELDSGPGLERAGLSGYVFLDREGTGRRDPGDEPLAGVRVLVEGRSVVTDEDGRWEVWDLVPWETARVELDTNTLRDPRWVSASGSVELPLSPASYRRLDLPVVRGGEVSGRVVRRNGGGPDTGVAGVDLLLVDLSRPGRTERITTFSDGQFYIMGLRPGAWEVRILPGILEPLRLIPDHFRRIAIVDPAGDPGPEILFRLDRERIMVSPVTDAGPTLPLPPPSPEPSR